MVVMQATDVGAVLMHVGSGDCFELNIVGAEIWSRLARDEDVAQIAAALAAEYQIPVERAAADVAALIAELSRRGLIAPR